MTSTNVPSPLLRNRKLGFMSLATYRSIRPSPLRSAATTPKPWPSERPTPARSVTSVKVWSPLLR